MTRPALSDEVRAFLSATQRSTTTSPPRLARDQLGGRLVELSAHGAAATLTCAVGLVIEAQQDGEPVAWIAPGAACFYPPDLADSGVDLGALIVVRSPDVLGGLRAAERLLRSGAFGLVVIDLVAAGAGRRERADVSMAYQGRLVTLAQRHDAAVVCVTDKIADAPSIGSLISLRAEAMRRRDRDAYACAIRALKDKQRGPGWSQVQVLRGPAGLR
jgi:recombination protein RecA